MGGTVTAADADTVFVDFGRGRSKDFPASAAPDRQLRPGDRVKWHRAAGATGLIDALEIVVVHAPAGALEGTVTALLPDHVAVRLDGEVGSREFPAFLFATRPEIGARVRLAARRATKPRPGAVFSAEVL